MRKHIVIGGTGRAGTSFLVALLTKLGFDTGFTPATLRLHPLSRAGLELDIRRKNAPYIVKNPWLSQTLSEALEDPDIRIEHAIVPVRSMVAATASRRRVDRLAKREGAKLPGGLWLTDDPARQREGNQPERQERDGAADRPWRDRRVARAGGGRDEGGGAVEEARD